jgi:tetratricopeptide (TPR) repeat protein
VKITECVRGNYRKVLENFLVLWHTNLADVCTKFPIAMKAFPNKTPPGTPVGSVVLRPAKTTSIWLGLGVIGGSVLLVGVFVTSLVSAMSQHSQVIAARTRGEDPRLGATVPTAFGKPGARSDVVAQLAVADRDFHDSRHGWGWSDKCWNHLQAKRLANAKAACERGLQEQPEKPAKRALLFNMGLICEQNEQWEQALLWVQKAYAVDPDPRVLAKKRELEQRLKR